MLKKKNLWKPLNKKMCELEFISIENAASPLCGYLLAKFIIFCIFISFFVLYVLCSSDTDPALALKLFVMAVAFELIGVLVGIFYIIFAVVFCLDMICCILVACCCCCIYPLVNHATQRRQIYADVQREFAATWLVGVALEELFYLVVVSRRVAAEGVVPPRRRRVIVLEAARDLAVTMRCALSVI